MESSLTTSWGFEQVSEIIIYEPTDGGHVTVRLEGESLWLTQEQMAELFGRERSVIAKHIRNVFREEELEEGSVCANFARTAGDGKIYQTQHYNLDAIISVGYRDCKPEPPIFPASAQSQQRRGFTLNSCFPTGWHRGQKRRSKPGKTCAENRVV